MCLARKLQFLYWRYLVGEGDLGKVKGDRCEVVSVSLRVPTTPLLLPSVSHLIFCHGSQRLIQLLLVVPKAVLRASQVRNYFSNNIKQLLVFSFSFFHECSVVVSRDYLMYNIPTHLQKQI